MEIYKEFGEKLIAAGFIDAEKYSHRDPNKRMITWTNNKTSQAIQVLVNSNKVTSIAVVLNAVNVEDTLGILELISNMETHELRPSRP